MKRLLFLNIGLHGRKCKKYNNNLSFGTASEIENALLQSKKIKAKEENFLF
jgi:hypothetical protein